MDDHSWNIIKNLVEQFEALGMPRPIIPLARIGTSVFDRTVFYASSTLSIASESERCFRFTLRKQYMPYKNVTVYVDKVEANKEYLWEELRECVLCYKMDMV